MVNVWATKNTKGFTIVELLIVIVIIAILAAITIVSFNGIQQRATFTKIQTDLGVIRKSLELYHAENDAYPVTGTLSVPGWRYSCSTGMANFIASLAIYITSLPQAPCNGGGVTNDTWIYGSDGNGYKLLHIRPSASVASNVPVDLRDFRYSATSPTWGYWTSDWAAK